MTKHDRFLPELKILDISEGLAGPFCAKLLADLGADVVKVEPPGGDRSRQLGPFPEGIVDGEHSATFFFANTSKRGCVLDLDAPADRDTFFRLLPRYDIVIAGESHERLAARGLGLDELRRGNPDVILTTVSGFGSFAPYSTFRSSHLVNCAMGGWAQLCGVPEREPLQTGGAGTETLTGAYAAAATLLAAFGRAHHGHGEHVDVSAQEAVLCGAQIPSLMYEYRGLVVERYSSVGSGAGAGYMLPTQDGYIGLNALTLAQWFQLCEFMGRGDIATDPHFEGISWTNPDERLEELREIFRAALADKTADELFHEAQKWRVPFGLVPTLDDLLHLPPHQERGFYRDVSHPGLGDVATPSFPFLSSNTTPTLRPPPRLGEHTEELMAELADLAPEEPATYAEHGAPLAGIRVVDLSMFFAGPSAAQILADAGADVIKVESVQRIDGWRGAGTGDIDGVPTWEASPYFNWINRNKRAITLDLTDERGIDIVKRLIVDADVVIENYTPRVMDNFGLTWELLQRPQSAPRHDLALRLRPRRQLAGLRGLRHVDRADVGRLAAHGLPRRRTPLHGHDRRRPLLRCDGCGRHPGGAPPARALRARGSSSTSARSRPAICIWATPWSAGRSPATTLGDGETPIPPIRCRASTHVRTRAGSASPARTAPA